MQLLYCNSTAGTVLGWCDSAQNIVASAFGADRVIPFTQSVETLPRVGAPPSDPNWKPSMGDPRPFAQPTETPALLIAYAGQKRWEASTAGITYTVASGAIPLATDRISQSLIGDLLQYAASLSDQATQIDFTQDGVHYPVLASEVPGMFAAINDAIQQGRTIEANCIADQNSPTPTFLTYADIDAQFAALMGRGLKKK
jgi:hypothetical protein